MATVVELARDAEAAGWDGFFGALITPLARRRPWKYANETATLDRLSHGRLVAGVGLGINSDFFPVGERWTAPERAARLDEGLDVVSALWTGEPVNPWTESLADYRDRVRRGPS